MFRICRQVTTFESLTSKVPEVTGKNTHKNNNLNELIYAIGIIRFVENGAELKWKYK